MSGAHEATSDSDRELGTTRGSQPIDPVPLGEDLTAAEEANEAAITADREQIGTTRGGQPIETLAHPDE